MRQTFPRQAIIPAIKRAAEATIIEEGIVMEEQEKRQDCEPVELLSIIMVRDMIEEVPVLEGK